MISRGHSQSSSPMVATCPCGRRHQYNEWSITSGIFAPDGRLRHSSLPFFGEASMQHRRSLLHLLETVLDSTPSLLIHGAQMILSSSGRLRRPVKLPANYQIRQCQHSMRIDISGCCKSCLDGLEVIQRAFSLTCLRKPAVYSLCMREPGLPNP